MSIIEKARKNLQELKENLEEVGGRWFFYNIKNNNYKSIVIANNEKELEKKMEKKLKKNPEKYKDTILARVYILTNEKYINKIDWKGNLPTGGALAISVMIYKITDDLELTRVDEHRQQDFWYNDEELANRDFSMDDLKMAIKAVYKNKVDMSPFMTYQISELDKIMREK